MQKITPHLWFDKEAKEAAKFYTAIFPKSKVTNVTTINGVPTPTKDCDIVSFEIEGHPFMAINGGPLFKFNPSISFMVNFDPSQDKNALENLNMLWKNLAEEGSALMPLDKYPFSERYGWIQDKFGLSWQLILTDPQGEKRPRIIPSFMFTGAVAGRAEEAITFYLSLFNNSKLGLIARYGEGHEPDPKGTIMFADFMLNGQWFAAMDSAYKHGFGFNEAISLLIPCETQDEIDYFWTKLSAETEAEQCGWLKDKFGVSWQVWPTALGEMMSEGTAEQVARLTKTFLSMKKFDIATLQQAFKKDH